MALSTCPALVTLTHRSIRRSRSATVAPSRSRTPNSRPRKSIPLDPKAQSGRLRPPPLPFPDAAMVRQMIPQSLHTARCSTDTSIRHGSGRQRDPAGGPDGSSDRGQENSLPSQLPAKGTAFPATAGPGGSATLASSPTRNFALPPRGSVATRSPTAAGATIDTACQCNELCSETATEQ